MAEPSGPVRGQGPGAYVRERRRANRLTQQELAELAGVGLRFLKELEQGKPSVQLERVNAVLAVFGKQVGVVDRPRDTTAADSTAAHETPGALADRP